MSLPLRQAFSRNARLSLKDFALARWTGEFLVLDVLLAALLSIAASSVAT